MRKACKKLWYTLLIAAMLCMMLGISAAAEFNYDETGIFYLEGNGKYAKGSGEIGAYEDGSGASSILRSSLKSSTPSVAALKFFRYTSYQAGSHDEDGKDSSVASREYQIGLTLKKAGTTKISFQAGKKKYTSTVKVLPYQNPLAVVNLSGVRSGTNPNLTGLLKNKNFATVRMSATQKKAVLTLKAAPGWEISYVSYENPKRGLAYSVGEEGDAATLTLGYFPAASNAKLRIEMRNKKNYGTISCIYTIK